MQFLTSEKLNKLEQEVRRAIYRQVCPIPGFKYLEGDPPGAAAPEFDDSHWADFPVGARWGGYDKVAWFRARVPIPPGWQAERLYLRFLVGPRDGGGSTAETMLYVNGSPLQAIDVWHPEAWLPPEHLQRDEISVALRAWSGVLDVPDQRRFKVAELILIDETTERFYHLAHTLLQTVGELDENSLGRIRLLQALDEAYRYLAFRSPNGTGPASSAFPETFYRSVQQAYACLQRRVAELARPDELKPRVVGIGHAHIDMAWLWRLQHTREKARRTFTTVLHLMRQYPEYRFTHSSPQLYRYIQEDDPDLFARIKERVHGCQWEITGGMWIEPDVNLPAGESLVRQFLLGKTYIRREFARDSRVLWLPDVFGFSWALPQIARKSGIDVLVTSKMSWNQFNRLPYDTFRWRGIDGSELLTHFVTAQEYLEGEGRLTRQHTYNAGFFPGEVRSLWQNYQQKADNDELLLLFGRGDGGGGPTKEMLEGARALRDLPSFPSVTLEKAELFFERMAARLREKALPVWDGELYPEFHRGTFTSQAFNKRANRKAEILYHVAEWLSALVDILGDKKRYPTTRLHDGWERLLLNQFHDILTGSSIRQVYEDSYQDYLLIEATGQEVATAALEQLSSQIGVQEDSVVVFNPLSWPRAGLVAVLCTAQLAGKSIQGDDGQPLPCQVVAAERSPLDVTSSGESHGEQMLLLPVANVPALGYACYPLVDTHAKVPAPIRNKAGTLSVSPRRLENRFYRIELNDQGQLTSLWDRQQEREVLAAGERGNVFQSFIDKPLYFDAWDIDIYYRERMEEVTALQEAVVEETGPLRGVLRLVWQFGHSTICQRLTIYRDSPRIDFRTEVNWAEQDLLLKVSFPVAIRATRATYDIQFGAIERPTHWNTSWDYARFEVPAHHWADLSEGNYGVALLNDCKYGYDVKDNVLRLTLIKSARWPDEHADQGHHTFTYSLLPHAGDWRQGKVVAHGYELNVPLLSQHVRSQPQGKLPQQMPFVVVDTEHVILETVKQAEDGDGWIVRFYEAQQARYRAVTVSFCRPLRRVAACNLLEEAEDDRSLRYAGAQLTFAIDPYEIKSFRVWF